MQEKKILTPAMKKLFFSLVLLVVSIAVAIPSFAWFYRKTVAAYAPVSSNESLYIGAGHIEITESGIFDSNVPFEDVRYLYLNGIDATDPAPYQDFVFCVYGESISRFRLQLGYTTNNQFTYEIYNAVEQTAAEYAEDPNAGAIMYITHAEDSPLTYYYAATGAAIEGRYLNKSEVNGEVIADGTKHEATYGLYDDEYVNTYAEPIYWQVASAISGASNSAFVKYFILRVYKGDKTTNDRQPDVICIAAKSSSGLS